MRLAALLTFSALSGFLEVGSILFAALGPGSFTAAVQMALAYQIGTLVPLPLTVSQTGVRVLVTGGVALTAASIALPGSVGPITLVALASAIINLSRMALGKAHVPVTLKRSFRVAGFMAAPLLMLPGAIQIAVIGVLALGSLVLWSYRPVARSAGHLNTPVVFAALLTHQIHYFCYYAAVIVILVTTHGSVIGTFCFILGWISYISTPHVFSHRLSPGALVVCGHVALAGVLAGLGMASPGGWAWLTLWILTGFLGGTVVYLTALARQRFGFGEAALAGTENTGHVLGAAIAWLWLAGAGSPGDLFFMAATFALATAALVAVATRPRSGTMADAAP